MNKVKKKKKEKRLLNRFDHETSQLITNMRIIFCFASLMIFNV